MVEFYGRVAGGWSVQVLVRMGTVSLRRHCGWACFPHLSGWYDMAWEQVLGRIASTAREHPSLTVCVNHCGGAVGPTAFQRTGVVTEWEDRIKELASLPNVVMKVGGLQMPANGFPITRKDIGEGKSPVGSAALAEMTFPMCVNLFLEPPRWQQMPVPVAIVLPALWSWRGFLHLRCGTPCAYSHGVSVELALGSCSSLFTLTLLFLWTSNVHNWLCLPMVWLRVDSLLVHADTALSLTRLARRGACLRATSPSTSPSLIFFSFFSRFFGPVDVETFELVSVCVLLSFFPFPLLVLLLAWCS